MALNLKKHIREVPDFPKTGINFKDITTLLRNKTSFRAAVDELCKQVRKQRIKVDAIAVVESRGFTFGSAMAYKLGTGVILVRKPNKLPARKIKQEYALEYGTDSLEMHADAVKKGQKVLIVDDLLATGGTALAVARLVERLGGKVAAMVFVVELDFLNGRKKLEKYPVVSLVHYHAE
jgi:adenine phosphoribosyltransferase